MTSSENNATGMPSSQRPPLSPTAEAERAEDQYFDTLISGDADRIDKLLDDDFLIVDVMSGGVTDRASFIAALRDGLLQFEQLQLVERTTRRYGDTVVIVGRTQMAGSFDGAPFAVASRYTHVLVPGGDERWRLASAQGTRIADDPRSTP